MNNSRLRKIGKKMDMAGKMMAIAVAGLASANKKNPFISKSDAMKRVNEVRNYQRQLSNIWMLEQCV